jgi:hypothetical protein
MKQLKATALLMSLLLAACGGGGGYSDDDDGGGDGGSGGGSATVSRVILLSSSPQLPSAADQPTEGITLSAQALDASGNLITASTINFSIPPSSGALIVGADDGSGTRTATLTTAGDPAPRTITVTATAATTSAAGVSASRDIPVTGTTLTLTGPDAIGFGRGGQYVATLLDSAGAGIGGAPITFNSSAGSLSVMNATSNSVGVAQTTLTGSASGNVTAQALGLSATRSVAISSDQFSILAPTEASNIALNTPQPISVQWLREGSATETAGATVNLSASRGTVTPNTVTLDDSGRATASITSANAGGAVIVASSPALPQPSTSVSVEFVATTASAINVQASPATLPVGESSVVTATVRDAAGNLVKNKTVDFTLTDVSGGTLSAPSAVTSSQGKASVTYNASSVSSADRGVQVRAVVRDTPSVFSTVAFTVRGQALRITLGTGNEIFEPNETTYQLPYTVLVTDSSGNAVTDATFRLSVLPVAYRKGMYAQVDVDGDDTADAWAPIVSTFCDNEDVDYDGVLDPGEDFNGNTRLDPGTVASVPATLALDSTGAGQFNITYPQDRASWVVVELRGVATVAGTESTESAIFVLPASAPDLSNLDVSPPGATSPYGTAGSCASPN